jgi:antitoxin (DNA-binding transcriptional repressor) of toxin-antitoxin stability system
VSNSAAPPYSHSIVSGAYKHLKLRDFLPGYAGLTVNSTAEKFRLGAIDGDRYRTTDTIPIAPGQLEFYDHLWSYIVMKQVRIAELKSKLSEFLRTVQRGESLAVLDRNTAIAHIVPIREQRGLRIRKPASGIPAPNKVPLPNAGKLKLDVLDLLLEERQSHR